MRDLGFEIVRPVAEGKTYIVGHDCSWVRDDAPARVGKLPYLEVHVPLKNVRRADPDFA